jgi:hypothetical protein
MAVRFGRQVDEAKLAQLPRRGGSVMLHVDAAFWTDRQRVSRIPIARREQSFIIGPGAAAMAGRMLGRMFDEVVDVRHIDRVEDRERFDYVIRLVHDSFDSRTLFLPLLTNRRFEVGIGAEISRGDGSPVSRVAGVGADSFWRFGPAPPDSLFQKDSRVLLGASRTLNVAVQASLFQLMDALDEAVSRPAAGESNARDSLAAMKASSISRPTRIRDFSPETS